MNKTDMLGALGTDPQAAALLNDREKLKKLLGSNETKKILQMLNSDGGQGLKNAIEALGKGNSEEAKEHLRPLVGQSDFEALMRQLEDKVK